MNWMIQKRERQEVPLLASVSVNLESQLNHAQTITDDIQLDPVEMYRKSVPRILAFLDRMQIRATFFVVAQDLLDYAVVDCLAEISARGHEIASHTYSCPGNLRAWSKLTVAEEIEQSSDAILHAIGQLPVGFRTPGYNVDTRILQLLAERGYKYDSSVLPSLSYYLSRGRTSVISSLLSGRADRSRIAAHSLRAPLEPYRPSRWAFWEAGDRKHSLPIWEIPIGVVRGIGVPMTGTLVGNTKESVHRFLYKGFQHHHKTLQWTLHAIDFLDKDDTEVFSKRRRIQISAGTSKATKLQRLQHFLAMLKNDYRIIPLEELADELSMVTGPTVLG